ncbi:MAG: sarcosine oxidase subunit gamma [Paracoccaceae bacterium]
MTASVSSVTPGVLVETSAARVVEAPAVGRLSLRARGELAPFDAAFGAALPARIGQRATSGAAEAIRLGPDEWTIIAPADQLAAIIAAFAGIYAAHPHSLVDVSGREVTYAIDGLRAADLLTLGMARDVASIPSGEGRRTVFDGVTVTLWRDGDARFRMDVWNSFAVHVLSLLVTGCRELAAETL